MDTSIQNSELIFTKHGLITIDSQKELTMNKTSLLNSHIICKPKSSLVATNITVTSGRGISAEKHTLLELDNSCFRASYISATQLSKLLITNTKFDEFIDAPALNILECSDVTLENCAFKQSQATQLNAKSIKYCAIRANTSFIYIANSKFNNCSSSEDGGAIRLQSCLFGMVDCTFTGCHSDQSGGAIAISGETYINSEEADYKNDNLSRCLSNPELIKKENKGGLFGNIFDEVLNPWVPIDNQIDAKKQPLIAKTLFKACKALDLGGAILDRTGTIRLLECAFEDNTAISEGNSLALLGKMSLVKWGVDMPNFIDPNWVSKSDKMGLNADYCKIVKCKFVSDSKRKNSGIYLQRLYQPHFMDGCFSENTNVLVQYTSIDYKQAGVHFMEIDWQDLLSKLEKYFSERIERNNTLKHNGSNAKKFENELEQLEYKLANPQLKISFDRHLLPSELQNKG